MPVFAPAARGRLVRRRRWVAYPVSLAGSMLWAATATGAAADDTAMHFIERRLPAPASLAEPMPPTKHAATDAELAAAFAATLADLLAPPGTFEEKVPGLVESVCRARPAEAPRWAGIAAEAVLARRSELAATQLEDVVAVTIAARPSAAAVVIVEVLRALLLAAERRAQPLDLATAGEYARRSVLAAIRAAASGPDARARITEISGAAVELAIREQALYLVVPAMAASIEGGVAVDKSLAGSLADEALARFGQTKELAGLLCVGALRGGGVQLAPVIKERAAISLPVPSGAYTTIVCNVFVAVSEAAGDPSVLNRFISVSIADFIPAAVLGGVGARADAAAALLRAGLDRDRVLRSRATTAEILGAALLADPSRAAELAAAAVDRGDLTEENPGAQIAESLARSAPVCQAATAFSALVAARTRPAGELRTLVAGAITGATEAKRSAMLPDILAAIAAAGGASADVLDQAIVSAPPESQAAAVLGVLAGDRAQAPALLESAVKRPELSASQAVVLASSGPVLLAIQRDPLSFPAVAAKVLAQQEIQSPDAIAGILRAAVLANPRSAPAVAALAAVRSDCASSHLVEAVAGRDRAVARTAATAVEIARRLQAAPESLFHIVREEIAAHPDRAAEFVTGALAARPGLAPVIAGAAAAAAPEAVAEVVPHVFLFSSSSSGTVPPDAAAALTGAMVRAIQAAGLDHDSEERAVAAVAAVGAKSVLGLAAGLPADSSHRDAALAAVVTAAIRAAGAHSIAITRAVSRAVRALSRHDGDREKIAAAVLAVRPAAEGARIREAIAAAFADADAQVPAAGVRRILDYSDEPLPGVPMTRFRNY